jgi:hypothetical protein
MKSRHSMKTSSVSSIANSERSHVSHWSGQKTVKLGNQGRVIQSAARSSQRSTGAVGSLPSHCHARISKEPSTSVKGSIANSRSCSSTESSTDDNSTIVLNRGLFLPQQSIESSDEGSTDSFDKLSLQGYEGGGCFDCGDYELSYPEHEAKDYLRRVIKNRSQYGLKGSGKLKFNRNKKNSRAMKASLKKLEQAAEETKNPLERRRRSTLDEFTVIEVVHKKTSKFETEEEQFETEEEPHKQFMKIDTVHLVPRAELEEPGDTQGETTKNEAPTAEVPVACDFELKPTKKERYVNQLIRSLSKDKLFSQLKQGKRETVESQVQLELHYHDNSTKQRAFSEELGNETKERPNIPPPGHRSFGTVGRVIKASISSASSQDLASESRVSSLSASETTNQDNMSHSEEDVKSQIVKEEKHSRPQLKPSRSMSKLGRSIKSGIVKGHKVTMKSAAAARERLVKTTRSKTASSSNHNIENNVEGSPVESVFEPGQYREVPNPKKVLLKQVRQSVKGGALRLRNINKKSTLKNDDELVVCIDGKGDLLKPDESSLIADPSSEVDELPSYESVSNDDDQDEEVVSCCRLSLVTPFDEAIDRSILFLCTQLYALGGRRKRACYFGTVSDEKC